MITSSFHTHTYLCKHATGVPSEYAKIAEEEGGLVLGISDHCPYFDNMWGGSRMSVCEVTQYILDIESARRATPSLSLLWGFECEWAPEYDSWYRDYLKAELGAQFLVYGAHWVKNEGQYWYIPDVSDKRLLRRYTDMTLKGIQSGLFSLFAHPDILLSSFSLSDPDVHSACADIISCAVAMNLPLEINGLGFAKRFVTHEAEPRPPYPVAEFFEMAVEAGATIVCCSDAHRPSEVLSGARLSASFAQHSGIPVTDAAYALGFATACSCVGNKA